MQSIDLGHAELFNFHLIPHSPILMVLKSIQNHCLKSLLDKLDIPVKLVGQTRLCYKNDHSVQNGRNHSITTDFDD